MDVTDVVRIFVIVLGTLVILTTLSIVVVYSHVHRTTAPAGPRFLPHHVGAIAASFIMLAVYGMAEMVARLGEPLTWRSPTLLVAFSLANVAQAIMLNVVRAQGNSHA